MLNATYRFLVSMAPMWGYILNYVFALCFLATVPVMLYYFFFNRRR